jgi:hypothetical protein
MDKSKRKMMDDVLTESYKLDGFYENLNFWTDSNETRFVPITIIFINWLFQSTVPEICFLNTNIWI